MTQVSMWTKHRPIVKDVDYGGSVDKSRWRDRAACLDHDPELFFPIGESGPDQMQIEEAKAVCRACPVWETCLQWARDTDQREGIWGGHTYRDRVRLNRRKTRRAKEVQETPPADDA